MVATRFIGVNAISEFGKILDVYHGFMAYTMVFVFVNYPLNDTLIG